ncbi:MAG: sugar phosphate isomerase/epimerase family protein, partial [Limisphaerales bacterium]
MNRRQFIAALPALAAARAVLADAGAARCRLGICTFSCHQHWRAVASGDDAAKSKFHDAVGFYRYARELGAEGVQTALPAGNAEQAKRMRAAVEVDGGYYEGDLRLPRSDSDVAGFEAAVGLHRDAGAAVARAVFTSGRRYEVFKTMDEFRSFTAQAEKSLRLAEPVLRRHRLRLAMENHKDHTAEELAALMRRIGSEWIGVLVDTGNNLALLEEPRETLRVLAPFVLSVHLKDMAVQPHDDGFLLSEVPLGTGALDIPLVVRTLAEAKPGIVFNLEMATRDPLRVPCRTEAYFATLPGHRGTRAEAMLRWVHEHPPMQPPPTVTGKPRAQVL